MYHIENCGIIRYGELKRKIPNINERVLTRQLRELEDCQLISRKVYDEVPPKVEYSITKTGKTLTHILIELGDWGKEYNKNFNYGMIDFKDEYE